MANFKFKLKVFKSGFSLVELMISLIIISLVAAAFAPVITKKLKNSSIVAGSIKGSTSNSSEDKKDDDINKSCSEISENCTLCAGDTCLSCKNKCEAGETLNTSNCTCEFKGTYYIPINGLHATKFAMGDSKYTQIPDSAGVKVVDKNTTCGSSSEKYYTAKCCWKATIDNSSYCNSNNGSYSGCERTVCTWAAANAICENYKQDGKTWRLPSTSETSSWWSDYSVGKGDDGLMLCINDYRYTAQDISMCATNIYGLNETSSMYHECTYDGIDGQRCNLDRIWNKEKVDGYNMYYTAWAGGSNNGWHEKISWTEPSTVRCVSDIVPNCKQYSGNSTCILCQDGYYLINNTCQKLTQVSNCATYSTTQNKCESCNSGYTLKNNSCVASFDCSGQYFMKIGSLCVTKYNMGDSAETQIPTNMDINIVSAGSTCGSSSNYYARCCWKGGTSGGNCDSANGDYSGCTRTVCNGATAYLICANYNYGGKTWRLPTSSEMANWSTYSKSLGNNGLMLCDASSGYSSAYCGIYYNGCYGSYNNNCLPYGYYGYHPYGSPVSNYCVLYDGVWRCSYNWDTRYPFSVRCVADM